MPPLRSRAPRIEGDKIRIGYITPAFSRAQKWAVLLRNPCVLGGSPIEGDEIRSGYITRAFSRARKWAVLLRNPCVLRGPQ